MRPPRLAVLAAVLLVATGCARPADVGDDPTASDVPDEVRYVALGDSIATGSAASTSYVAEFADRFAADTGSSVEVTNAGVPGLTTSGLLDAVSTDTDLRAAITDAHLVTFNTGGNDLLPALGAVIEGRCGGSDDEDCLRAAVTATTTTWDDLLAELGDLVDGEVAGLRTMDLYRPAAFGQLDPASVRALERHLAEVNGHIRDSAAAAGIEVARVSEAFDGSGDGGPGAATDLLAGDGIHPNDRGHVVIAETLLELGPDTRG